jgi:acetolactate synthase-1/2/3 large subunit
MTSHSLPQPYLETGHRDDPRNLADLTVEHLELLGVEYVFGVPGGHIMPLYEALARSEKRGGPRAVLTRHESGAAYMADGYARETGKLGVCCATTGPGVTNIVTGIASSYFDNTPVLLITGQTSLVEFGAGSFQESSPDVLDTTAMLAPCTRYSTVVTHPKQFERKFATALRHAFHSPGGPVHLSLPVDIYRSPVEASVRAHAAEPHSAVVDQFALEALWLTLQEVLRQGRRIALLVGHEAVGATDVITAFAEAVNARMVATHRGKNWVDHFHPLASGVFGYAGHETARRALADEAVGLILAAGTNLGQWSTSSWDPVLLNDKLVHIHPAREAFARSTMGRLQVQGKVKPVFEALLARIRALPPEGQAWLQPFEGAKPAAPRERGGVPGQIKVLDPAAYRSDAVPLHPQRLMDELMRRCPPETRFTIDNCNWLPWSIHHFFPAHCTRYRISSELGAMGWGIGAAIGTAMANRGTPVVCLTGDGCFAMYGQEIAVAVAEQVPVIFVVSNDRGFGMVKHRHRQISSDPLELSLPYVDFSLIAKAVGAEGYTLRQPGDFNELDFEYICARKGPTVLNILTDPEAVPPMGMF